MVNLKEEGRMFSSTMSVVCLVLMLCSLATAIYMAVWMVKGDSVKVAGGLLATVGIWAILYGIINIMVLIQQSGKS